MTALASLNGASLNEAGRPRPCPFAGRRSEETLHDFLLRRHDEMADELVALQAEITWQTDNLRAERQAAHRRDCWLIAALALDATFALLLCLLWIFEALPAPVAAITLAVLLAGNLLAVAMPRLENILGELRPWWRP